jgi:hypothetical protein
MHNPYFWGVYQIINILLSHVHKFIRGIKYLFLFSPNLIDIKNVLNTDIIV